MEAINSIPPDESDYSLEFLKWIQSNQASQIEEPSATDEVVGNIKNHLFYTSKQELELSHRCLVVWVYCFSVSFFRAEDEDDERRFEYYPSSLSWMVRPPIEERPFGTISVCFILRKRILDENQPS